MLQNTPIFFHPNWNLSYLIRNRGFEVLPEDTFSNYDYSFNHQTVWVTRKKYKVFSSAVQVTGKKRVKNILFTGRIFKAK